MSKIIVIYILPSYESRAIDVKVIDRIKLTLNTLGPVSCLVCSEALLNYTLWWVESTVKCNHSRFR